MYSIGIDLGTTYSCCAIYKDGNVNIILNDDGQRTTPSIVSFSNGERIVGRKLSTAPENSIYCAKRFIGVKYEDVSHSYPFKIINDGGYAFEVEGKRITPIEISAHIIAKMKKIGEDYTGCPIENAVITVPAYFNDSQRQATKDAGEIAGLNVMRIINEPTAAAIAYGLGKIDEKVLVFDLGGGSFDISILQIDDGFFEVITTGGDTHLGGEDFNIALYNHVAGVFNKKYGVDISSNKRAISKLMDACEKAKRNLSCALSATIEIDSLHNGFDFTYQITRSKFESLCGNLFVKCMDIVLETLKSKEIEPYDINNVVLVGGSTRIPKIQELLKLFFGKELCKEINPDEAVAYGACIQSKILFDKLNNRNELKQIVLLDVVPLSLGVQTHGGFMTKIVEKDTTIPTKKTHTFSTFSDNQSSVSIKIYEGERAMAIDNNMLGQFRLDGIPPMKRGIPLIEVEFNVDSNGILSVSAMELSSKKKKTLTITENKGRLSNEEILRMKDDAQKYCKKDKDELERKNRINSLDKSLCTIRRLLEDRLVQNPKSDGDDKELIKLNAKIRSYERWLSQNQSINVDIYSSMQSELDGTLLLLTKSV